MFEKQVCHSQDRIQLAKHVKNQKVLEREQGRHTSVISAHKASVKKKKRTFNSSLLGEFHVG